MNWWRRFLKRGEMDRQLDAELRFHLESSVADNISAGMSEPDARRNARLQFGGTEQVKEECRDARGTLWLERTVRDLRSRRAGGGRLLFERRWAAAGGE